MFDIYLTHEQINTKNVLIWIHVSVIESVKMYNKLN